MMSTETNYTQGYSAATTSSHASRTVASDASFLLPYIKPTDKILDVGCGPGTITIGFSAHVPQGSVTGIDLSGTVLASARALASEMRADGRLNATAILTFEEADILRGLPYEDGTFDLVFASQLFPHLPPPTLPAEALKEMRRVVRPGGIVASRDAAAQHFFPRELGLAALLTANTLRGLGAADWPGAGMPALYRAVGFDVEGGRVKVGCGTTCYADAGSRAWWAGRLIARLEPGDAVRGSWVKAGVAEDEIELCVERLRQWAETPDAWYGILQTEIVAWK
ncbi:S-adenosyl-L-methionine-dependent methyltransferase [Whalleya microplaca]|nr:S-adenosyl-L-methionine-dependent methyltransferase [Whalleya microplaca]